MSTNDKACTECGEPITEIEETLTPGTGPRHRTCPTLATWRDEAVRFARQVFELRSRPIAISDIHTECEQKFSDTRREAQRMVMRAIDAERERDEARAHLHIAGKRADEAERREDAARAGLSGLRTALIGLDATARAVYEEDDAFTVNSDDKIERDQALGIALDRSREAIELSPAPAQPATAAKECPACDGTDPDPRAHTECRLNTFAAPPSPTAREATKDDSWDKCIGCEHYRGEHSAKGECMCLIIMAGDECICRCKAFVATPTDSTVISSNRKSVDRLGPLLAAANEVLACADQDVGRFGIEVPADIAWKFAHAVRHAEGDMELLENCAHCNRDASQEGK